MQSVVEEKEQEVLLGASVYAEWASALVQWVEDKIDVMGGVEDVPDEWMDAGDDEVSNKEIEVEEIQDDQRETKDEDEPKIEDENEVKEEEEDDDQPSGPINDGLGYIIMATDAITEFLSSLKSQDDKSLYTPPFHSLLVNLYQHKATLFTL